MVNDLVAKKLKANEKSKKFVKEASIFGEWHVETPQEAARALSHDFTYWKLDKVVQDPNGQDKIKELMREHFMQLRSIFI